MSIHFQEAMKCFQKLSGDMQMYYDVHQLQMLITGSRLLLDDVLEEMRATDAFAQRVEAVCAMLEVTEGKARELKETIGEQKQDA